MRTTGTRFKRVRAAGMRFGHRAFEIHGEMTQVVNMQEGNSGEVLR